MKWTIYDPHQGNTRVVTQFAWFPTSTDDGTTVVWLERYRVNQTIVRFVSGRYKWVENVQGKRSRV